jgi:hypothetical protein
MDNAIHCVECSYPIICGTRTDTDDPYYDEVYMDVPENCPNCKCFLSDTDDLLVE